MGRTLLCEPKDGGIGQKAMVKAWNKRYDVKMQRLMRRREFPGVLDI